MDILPPVSDIALAILLVIPGFLSFILARKLADVDTRFSDFESTIISIFLSLVIYIPFTLLTGLSDIDKIRNGILVSWNLLILVIIAVAIGLALGAAFKEDMQEVEPPGTGFSIK